MTKREKERAWWNSAIEEVAIRLQHDPEVLRAMTLEQIREEVRSLPDRVRALKRPAQGVR